MASDGKKVVINPDLVMQFLHRAVSTVGIVVVFGFVALNWVLANLATKWVLPQEVVGTGQQAIAQVITLWLFARAIKKYGAAAASVFNGESPPAAPPTEASPAAAPKT